MNPATFMSLNCLLMSWMMFSFLRKARGGLMPHADLGVNVMVMFLVAGVVYLLFSPFLTHFSF